MLSGFTPEQVQSIALILLRVNNTGTATAGGILRYLNITKRLSDFPIYLPASLAGSADNAFQP